jgi:hypothetical protein
LSEALHPLVVVRWFLAPNTDLVHGSGEAALSPRAWLLAELDPDPVATLGGEL